MTRIATLPNPSFYDARRAAEWGYRPDAERLFAEAIGWQMRHAVTPAAKDKFRLHLLLIDMQKDFCFPEGTLYVGGRSGTGAVDDARRIAEFIYRNLSVITDITTTLDTHFAFQIFFAPFWETEDGKPLAAHTLINIDPTGALVNTDPTGKLIHANVRPRPAIAKWLCGGNYPWLMKQVRFYVEELKRGGKYLPYLWPSHCILGSDGHALSPIIHEARMFHSLTRFAQSWSEVKGGHPLTENYSVLRPEVLLRWDDQPLAQKNTGFIEKLLEADAVVIGGEAASHCVKSSIDDLLDEIKVQDPTLAAKVYVMEDCMSSVAVPDGKGGFIADFTPEAEKALRRFRDAGMHVVKSTDPIETWDGMSALVA